MTDSVRMKPKILVVDDDRLNINTLIELLGDQYEIVVAINGAMGIAAAEKTQPQLILLDITMPDMNGYEVLEVLKSREATGEIPVIFITGLDSAEDEAKGLNLGAADYISKPFQSTVVTARVGTQIRLKQQADQLAAWSMLDSLTGLTNARAFEEQVDALISEAQTQQSSLALLLVRIDFFSRFDDFYGQSAGDELVLKVAGAVEAIGVEQGYQLARQDQSTFVLAGLSSGEDELLALAEDLRSAVAALHVAHVASPRGAEITLSCGGMLGIPSRMSRAEQYFQLAESSLRLVERQGGNGVHLMRSGRRTYWDRLG